MPAFCKRGGNWRPERARALNIDPADDEHVVPVIKDACDLHLIVAGGWGRSPVHGAYAIEQFLVRLHLRAIINACNR